MGDASSYWSREHSVASPDTIPTLNLGLEMMESYEVIDVEDRTLCRCAQAVSVGSHVSAELIRFENGVNTKHVRAIYIPTNQRLVHIREHFYDQTHCRNRFHLFMHDRCLGHCGNDNLPTNVLVR